MAVSRIAIGCGTLPISPHSPQISYLKTHNSQLLSSNSCLTLNSKFVLPKLQINGLRYRKSYQKPAIFALQSNVFKVIQTAFQIGKDGVEAGMNLVPAAVPRPVARISVTIVATALALFVLKSFVSTVFFTLGFMGFIYFLYLAFINKDKGPKVDGKPGSTDEAVEQANKIMDKYK